MLAKLNPTSGQLSGLQMCSPLSNLTGAELSNGRTGTLVNSPTLGFDPEIGSYVNFASASSQAITYPLIDARKVDMYISVWVYFTTVAARADFVNVGTSGVNGFAIILLATSTVRLQAGGVGSGFQLNVTSGTWYHIVWTITSANFWTFYLNGVVGTSGAGFSTIDPTGQIELGRFFSAPSHAFFLNGRLADFRIGYYTPDATEVASWYHPHRRWALYRQQNRRAV
jgi:hypothetical protein